MKRAEKKEFLFVSKKILVAERMITELSVFHQNQDRSRLNDNRKDAIDCAKKNLHQLKNWAECLFSELSIEDLCKITNLKYIPVCNSFGLVIFQWTENSEKEAFIVASYGDTENKGAINFFHESYVSERFGAICLCVSCARRDGRRDKITGKVASVARKYGVKKIHTRIKRESFEVGSVVFQEITEFPNLASITSEFGEDAKLIYYKFFPHKS